MKFCLIVSLLGLLLSSVSMRASTPVPYATVFTPGTQDELPYLVKTAGASIVDQTRHAEAGQFWVYGFPVAPGARCRLGLTLDENTPTIPSISVLGPGDKPVPIRVERDPNNVLSVVWTVPDKWPLGTRMPVQIGAKNGPVTVHLARFVQVEPDSNNDGLPDSVAVLMTQGMPPTVRPTVFRAPGQPYTITQTGNAPNPVIDLQTDAVFAYTSDATVIAAWKARGYTAWTMGGSRDGKTYADKHPDEVQTTADGRPLRIEESYYLNPTANRLAIESAYYDTALANGSDGVCPEEPEYFAGAGYEGAFKQAWQQQFHAPWQDPSSSIDARWKASQIAATLEANHIATILNNAAQKKPGARRLVALHSPLNYADWGIICPQARITGLPTVQEVIGQVWAGTARTPARYAGVRSDHTFSVAYLEYSSLAQLLRGTLKRLWFLVDPLEDDPNRALTDYKDHYEQTVIAALLFPDVDAYEVMPWPDRVYGHIPAEYGIEVNSVIAAMQEMHEQKSAGGNAVVNDGIGVFVSDSMQWQRAAPAASDFDGVFGLTLPLLQRGVPVQLVSLDRAAEPGYLRPFKTLLLSYDFQKPPDARTQAALADWVRRGGSLLFFGGSDPYNAVADSWWRQAKHDAPQLDLWTQLGLNAGDKLATRAVPPEDTTRYQTLLQNTAPIPGSRRAYPLDLTRFAQQTGSVAVRFADATPQDGFGPSVWSAELRIGGQLAAAFQAGSEIENRFLVYDKNSQFNGSARFADGNSSWTYQFENLPRNTPITLTVDMGNGFLVSGASAQPDFGHTLLADPADTVFAKAIPRLRIGANYAVTQYPQFALPAVTSNSDPAKAKSGPLVAAPGAQAADATNAPNVLYTLRAGGAAIWEQTVGRGMAMNVGIAPGFFSAGERSAGLLRALTQYAQQRAGGAYREPGFLHLKRGRYTIVRTFGEPTTIEGRTIDLLSPTLAVAEDRQIPPRSVALLADLGPSDAPPHLGFVSGRVQAKIETGQETVFFVRGPQGTTGAARLHAGGKQPAGVRATDRLGHSVAVQTLSEGSTVLLRYPNSPDGVVVRIGWK